MVADRTVGGKRVSPVALGCWPIAGMTSLDVNDRDSRATIDAALASGVNHFDTAYCYGADGESESLLGPALATYREQVVVATKGGMHWDTAGQRCHDARPETLRRECTKSLARLQTDYVDLYYLHAPDPQVPVRESVGELDRLRAEGVVRAIGLSNVTFDTVCEVAADYRIDAVQPPYNMLQREIEGDLLPWCREHGVHVFVYWPLLKGLLAGKLPRDHRFLPGDGRAKYAMFQGAEWDRNQDLVDRLRTIAEQSGRTVAQLVISWTIGQPGITGALCGAKRPYQIIETASALDWTLPEDVSKAIDQALALRGPVVSDRPV